MAWIKAHLNGSKDPIWIQTQNIVAVYPEQNPESCYKRTIIQFANEENYFYVDESIDAIREKIKESNIEVRKLIMEDIKRAIEILNAMLEQEKKRLIIDELECNYFHYNNGASLELAIEALEEKIQNNTQE